MQAQRFALIAPLASMRRVLIMQGSCDAPDVQMGNIRMQVRLYVRIVRQGNTIITSPSKPVVVHAQIASLVDITVRRGIQ
jgi:hypothetical protein